jgi:glycosyltransferase involved in cell wall biosynthesis
MGAGLPVVATDAGAQKIWCRMVKRLSCPKENAHLLAERVLRLLSSQELRSQMGAAGRKRYEAIYLNRDFSLPCAVFIYPSIQNLL